MNTNAHNPVVISDLDVARQLQLMNENFSRQLQLVNENVSRQLQLVNENFFQLHASLLRFDAKFDAKFDDLNQRLTSLEGKVDALDQRLTSLEGKVDALERKANVRYRNTVICIANGHAGTFDAPISKLLSIETEVQIPESPQTIGEINTMSIHQCLRVLRALGLDPATTAGVAVLRSEVALYVGG